MPLHMRRTSSNRLVAEELAVAELEVAEGRGVAEELPLEDLVEIKARSDVRTATRRATLQPFATSFTQSKLLAPLAHVPAWPTLHAHQLSIRPSRPNWPNSERTRICALFSFLVPCHGIVVVPLPQWVELFGTWCNGMESYL